MLFNSTVFFVFLAIVLALYYGIDAKYRRWLIFVASYVFYGFWSVPFLSLLVGSTLVDYYASKCIDEFKEQHHKKLALLTSVVFNLGILILFKYADFFSNSAYALFSMRPWPVLNWVLPLGISFYTFQTMSYTIDVYRGHIKARKNILDVAIYVSFFPQLVAGPIIRAQDLLSQVHFSKSFSKPMFKVGMGLLFWGLAKKVLVADTMAGIVNVVYANPTLYSAVDIWLATYAFAVQIYCDFSGYSDVAIACALLLGVQLPENFNSPYLSQSIVEFWRRWHISLSTWLRDYLYIPLGGNRKGKVRTYLNLMITMLLGGLWHGAGWNWLVWGGLQGVFLSIEKALGISIRSQSFFIRVIRTVFTFHLVCLSWIFFRAKDFSTAIQILKQSLHFSSFTYSISLMPLAALALLLVFELGLLKKQYLAWCESRTANYRFLLYAVIIIFILIFNGSQNNEFIYFQF